MLYMIFEHLDRIFSIFLVVTLCGILRKQICKIQRKQIFFYQIIMEYLIDARFACLEMLQSHSMSHDDHFMISSTSDFGRP